MGSRIWQPAPEFLPGEFHGQRSLVGCNPGVAESDMTEHTHSYMRHLYIRHYSQCFMSINLLLTTILYGRVPSLHMFFRWGNRGTAWVRDLGTVI